MCPLADCALCSCPALQNGATPLHWAAKDGDGPVVSLFLTDPRVDVNVTDTQVRGKEVSVQH